MRRMNDPIPETKLKIYGPAPRQPESGCLDIVLQFIMQGTAALTTAIGTWVKGPLGWLLGALALALGVALFSLVIWLRNGTDW